MFRVLGSIYLIGSGGCLSRLAHEALIPNGSLRQIGLARKIPEPDLWCYSSPRYQFNLDEIDDEVRSFLHAHPKVTQALLNQQKGVQYAMFVICPVAQNEEDMFAGALSNETLQALAASGLALEIAPAPVMPDAEPWRSKD